MDSKLRIEPMTGHAVDAIIDDLAQLRMTVFAEYPYLYQGDAAYERDYLRAFVAARDAVAIVARCDGDVVGIATASPMTAQEAELRDPVAATSLDPAQVFYFGESVLLARWRGHGIGRAFFDHREEHARRCGARYAMFAAVVRPPDHPARAGDYRDLAPFWRRRGYAPVPGLVTSLDWQEHGEDRASAKPMQFWMRELD
ncbi:GNAT family N-acetyltransferase [Novosphingobium aquimarinum]|uniref:GNAT family N-acetyltransferase n=1 Tax=Novosphingobium aquimarinum TaxID=2682494 RepID=UPI001E4CA639|nr:GNAT family N-acetyltransferase [Novosphingobium aquimarinum]